MRCYHFASFYISSIQQGIQAAHAQMELAIKYKNPDFDSEKTIAEMFWDWAENHKTMICLNGGMTKDLQDLQMFILNGNHSYPYASFSESEEALGGILTNVAIVLPEKIYNVIPMLRLNGVHFDQREYRLRDPEFNIPSEFSSLTLKTYNNFDIELINKIKGYQLAK